MSDITSSTSGTQPESPTSDLWHTYNEDLRSLITTRGRLDIELDDLAERADWTGLETCEKVCGPLDKALNHLIRLPVSSISAALLPRLGEQYGFREIIETSTKLDEIRSSIKQTRDWIGSSAAYSDTRKVASEVANASEKLYEKACTDVCSTWLLPSHRSLHTSVTGEKVKGILEGCHESTYGTTSLSAVICELTNSLRQRSRQEHLRTKRSNRF